MATAAAVAAIERMAVQRCGRGSASMAATIERVAVTAAMAAQAGYGCRSASHEYLF